ncbi:pilus assembly PilX family protein [Undibacterium sp.]|jgi:type IV pilus assembly protein PilX|uniref:pilus assembly PilX family protein n=1 Tax=Undibacterium sp. TaxID=1914977 RepID=UPI002B68452C|nr:PilX N-terminal domain-containing pilus assembly protein [Undibacterium sp.]HTD02242.1 PilX N-terminal domain-containing pilus assembly protein [Undibacterium sp.]
MSPNRISLTNAMHVLLPCSPHHRKDRGIALITALLILVMLTLLAVSMFRGYGLQQKIAGNVREKTRAFEAAQSALQYGEWWLGQGAPGIGATCTGTVTVSSTANMRTCANALTTPSDPTSWSSALIYTPPAMQVSSTGGTATDGNSNADINYSAAPQLNISYIGLSPSGQQALYSVTGAGFGGRNNTVAVVQSVVAVTANVTSLDNP